MGLKLSREFEAYVKKSMDAFHNREPKRAVLKEVKEPIKKSKESTSEIYLTKKKKTGKKEKDTGFQSIKEKYFAYLRKKRGKK
ncbi:MAG: hypothetical protein A3K83_04475 [Omnitrophica WOR_2 bacterium RBG_13_44_8b]|nr:MAG: hypothetical protein A3K83_04475 [Omnitrophica WOR_2 bacterium RBG_13_44_8b]